MSEKTDFTPEEWVNLNEILTVAIAVAYPELCVTPYNREPTGNGKENCNKQYQFKQSQKGGGSRGKKISVRHHSRAARFF